MKLRSIKANMTEVSVNADLTVLFSYRTPVACHISGDGYSRTEKKWSATTTRHINQWVQGSAKEKPQSFFDELVEQV